MHSGVLNILVLFLGLAHHLACSPAGPRDQAATKALVQGSNLENLTSLLTSIPNDFRIELEIELPIRFPAEACFINIIAALTDTARGDFTGKMHLTNYRTPRFPQPLIKIHSPGKVGVERRYLVWGLFLVAFYLQPHSAFNMGFFSLQWKDEEVAGIGIAGTPRLDRPDSALRLPLPNSNVKVDVAFYGGPVDLGKGSVFMTIIASLLEAAPQAGDDRIYETVINYLNNEPAVFVLTPTPVARGTRGPFFTNELLIDTLSRTAEFYAAANIYRQLELKVLVNDVMVAQGAFTRRGSLGSLGFLNTTNIQAKEMLIA
ncbi:MAG: hypothetical protein LQ339_007932 [Xanthoria mediterranea]|nr:MAG: hypothetical protein LQ339_007932 [Xanthoria mediterranea]